MLDKNFINPRVPNLRISMHTFRRDEPIAEEQKVNATPLGHPWVKMETILILIRFNLLLEVKVL